MLLRPLFQSFITFRSQFTDVWRLALQSLFRFPFHLEFSLALSTNQKTSEPSSSEEPSCLEEPSSSGEPPDSEEPPGSEEPSCSGERSDSEECPDSGKRPDSEECPDSGEPNKTPFHTNRTHKGARNSTLCRKTYNNNDNQLISSFTHDQFTYLLFHNGS